jgi:hypothetical protein
LLWQWASCADYDASAGLDKIETMVFAINSTDDERNPPEAMTRIMKQIKTGRLFLILTSDEDQRASHDNVCEILQERAAPIDGRGSSADKQRLKRSLSFDLKARTVPV